MGLPVNSAALRYRAFLSYSHADERIAARLHRKLEAYRVPGERRVGKNDQLPARIKPVFRDREELSTATSLGSSIERALDESEALVVVCSPSSVASRWVNEEIRYFRGKHPDRPVLAFIAAGTPEADPAINPEKAAFPLNLLLVNPDEPDGERYEPLAADARNTADGFNAAFLKLTAGLIGVRYDQLRQRDLIRRQKRWTVISLALLVLTTMFAFMAWRATIARNEARAARAQAELELTSERQTRQFLLSVFELSQPDKARGYVPSVREVLDRAVIRIDSTQFTRPEIKSRFLATMGQAYARLGINQRSVELLEQSLKTLPDGKAGPEAWAQRIDSQLELADVLFDMGEYERSMALLDGFRDDEYTGRLTSVQSAKAYNEADDAAMAAYRSVIIHLDSGAISAEDNASIRSRSLVGMAVIDNFAGDYPSAQSRLDEATGMLLSVFGEIHPDTIWALSTQASIAYFNNDTDSANEAWSRLLEISLRVYDETNPEVGTLKNNLGRLLLENGENEAAEVYLRQALEIDELHRAENFDDKTYILNSLAISRMAQGDFNEASRLLIEALPIAQESNHRMLGQIQAALADINCRAEDAGSGIELSEQALASNQREHGEEDWRSHRARMVLAYCKNVAGKAVETDSLRNSLCVIRSRWPVPNYFTLRAVELYDLILAGQGKPRDFKPECAVEGL
jgi:tetratricopeptide (TPR) repeat protein